MAGNTVRVGAQVTGVGKASSDLDKLRDRFEKLQKQGAKGFAIGAGAAITAKGLNLMGAAAGGVVDAIGDAISAASNLNESMTLSQQVFEGNTDAVNEWAAGAADAFGQSQREALDFASNFGTAFKNVGLSLDETTDKAEAMTELAADLGSAFNASSQEAATAMRSGLLGESEPLRRFGVFLDEAKTKNKMLAMGMKATNGVFTDAQKVTARYAQILEQTADSQGMFGRDANSLADAQKSLDAQMENVTAEIGQRLLPIVLELTKGVRDNLVPAVQLLADTLGYVADAVDILGPTMERQTAHLDEWAGKIDTVSAAENEAALATRIWKQNMAVAAEKLAMVTDETNDAADATDGFTDSLEDARKAWDKLNDRIKANDEFANLPDKIIVAAGEVKEAQGELNTAIEKGNKVAIAAARIRLRDAKSELAELRREWAMLRVQMERPVRTGQVYHSPDSYQPRAAGGPASGVTLVGEKGPEIVDLPAGSYVHSNAESKGMAASLPAVGGGVTNFYVTANLSPTGYSPAQAEQVANAVGPAIATYLRRRGLLVA